VDMPEKAHLPIVAQPSLCLPALIGAQRLNVANWFLAPSQDITRPQFFARAGKLRKQSTEIVHPLMW
jgi:hypothetical protein